MKRFQLYSLTSCLLLGLMQTFASAHPPRSNFSFGLSVGAPYYHRPYFGPAPWHYHYVRPYPIYVAPRPIIVEQVPVYVQPTVVQPAPVVSPPSVYRSTSSASSIEPASHVSAASVEQQLQLLTHPDEKVRSEAVMELGRMKAERAVDPLAATLAGDRSAVVRESAARALGLIASPKGLPALTRAAQADSDRDVRRSAQFSVEVIHSNLRRN
jgi:hypothetical protein